MTKYDFSDLFVANASKTQVVVNSQMPTSVSTLSFIDGPLNLDPADAFETRGPEIRVRNSVEMPPPRTWKLGI